MKQIKFKFWTEQGGRTFVAIATLREGMYLPGVAVVLGDGGIALNCDVAGVTYPTAEVALAVAQEVLVCPLGMSRALI